MTVVDGSASRVGRGPTAGDPTSARSLHHTTVVTPEGVVLDFRSAGIGSRTLAMLLDVIVLFVALIGFLFAVVFSAVLIGGTAAAVFSLVGLFVIFFGYPIAQESLWGGQTLGKRALGLRVITVEGGPVGVRHATIRALLGLFDFWLPAPGGLLALAFALTTSSSQRLGDLAAGTIVVRRSRGEMSTTVFGPAPGAEAFGLGLDASRLTPGQYALAREYLLRAPELLPEPRAELAEAVADGLAQATGTVRPPGLDPDRFLHSLLFAAQRRHRTAEGIGSVAVSAATTAAPPPTGLPVDGPPRTAPVAAPPTGPAVDGPLPGVGEAAPAQAPSVPSDDGNGLGSLPPPSGWPVPGKPPPGA